MNMNVTLNTKKSNTGLTGLRFMSTVVKNMLRNFNNRWTKPH